MKKAPCKRKVNTRVYFAKKEEYSKFMELIKKASSYGTEKYTWNERVIMILKWHLGWSREKIREKSGLSTRFTRETIQKVRENES